MFDLFGERLRVDGLLDVSRAPRLKRFLKAGELEAANEELHATVESLMGFVPGPDFPTFGFIYGRQGIRDAYRTGRGIIRLRAKAGVEETFSYVSTAGGAFLEYLEGKVLPAVDILEKRAKG